MTATKSSARDRILDAAQSLVTEQGFTGTSIESILSVADASKGAFFHHFESKDSLGEALLRRYADSEAELLEELLSQVERESDDAAIQLVRFVELFEDAADDISANLPGCLFVSFVYERGLSVNRSDQIIVGSIELWRSRILEKLDAAARTRPRLAEIDLASLADQVFTIFEGAFILARATDQPEHMRKQLRHVRRYFALLLDIELDPDNETQESARHSSDS